MKVTEPTVADSMGLMQPISTRITAQNNSPGDSTQIISVSDEILCCFCCDAHGLSPMRRVGRTPTGRVMRRESRVLCSMFRSTVVESTIVGATTQDLWLRTAVVQLLFSAELNSEYCVTEYVHCQKAYQKTRIESNESSSSVNPPVLCCETPSIPMGARSAWPRQRVPPG